MLKRGVAARKHTLPEMTETFDRLISKRVEQTINIQNAHHEGPGLISQFSVEEGEPGFSCSLQIRWMSRSVNGCWTRLQKKPPSSVLPL